MSNTSFQSMHPLHSSGDYYVSSCHKSSAGLLVRFQNSLLVLIKTCGWSGGATVLGKLPASGRPTNLDYSRARAYCAYSRCGWELSGHFFSRLSFLSSFSLSLGDGLI